jgi:hypothetical protein
LVDIRTGWPLPEGVRRSVGQKIGDHQRETVAEGLLELARKDGAQLYGLLDSARSETVLQQLSKGETVYESLYRGLKAEERYWEVSPFLLECREESEIFTWQTTEAWGDSCSLYLISDEDLPGLVSHFQKFVKVVTFEEEELLFRFYDPRVLRLYLPTCNKTELEHFFGPVRRFLVEDETGETILTFAPGDREASKTVASSKPTDRKGRLIIRQGQMAAFSKATVRNFENRLRAHLQETYPEPSEALGEAGVREVIAHGMKRAEHYHLASEREICGYVELMFEFGRDFDRDPRHPWAGEILRDKTIDSSEERLSRLSEVAAARKNEATGITGGSEA